MVSLCDTTEQKSGGGEMRQVIFQVECKKCFFANSMDVAEVDCRRPYHCINCGSKLSTTEVIGQAVDDLEQRIETSGGPNLSSQINENN